MVSVVFDPDFKKNFKKLRDNSMKEKIIKQISKLKENPELGKSNSQPQPSVEYNIEKEYLEI